ncbi:sialidase family protein [Micromonospora sp. NPDC023966]|uniref:sialidase family protein n=1 Tax=Micromonospora sp. NPDC023966 TaxID=3154699 RepID=UPI0033C1F00A
MIEKHFVVRDVPGQCHGSTVGQISGSFVVAWFQGDHEGAANSHIWVSRGSDDEWTVPLVVSGDLAPCWNPVLHVQGSGALRLFCKVGTAISAWRTFHTISLDGGSTWSAPQPLAGDEPGGRGPVRTPPVRLQSGRLLAGASTEVWGTEPRWDSFVDISDDDGCSWHRTEDIAIDHDTFPGAGIIQPALWQASSGQVRLLARSTAGRLVYSSSDDNGESWSAGVLSSVANNNSGVSACAVGETVYLAHNPASGNWASRAPLLISRSTDDGASWHAWVTLEESVEAATSQAYQPADSGVITTGFNEFSYPCLIRTRDGLAVTYTWQRRGIVLALLNPTNRSNT